jgi:hypothetical protein
LSTKGEKEVQGMNTFVDILEGVQPDVSMRLPRRWVPRHNAGGNSKGLPRENYYIPDDPQERENAINSVTDQRFVIPNNGMI